MASKNMSASAPQHVVSAPEGFQRIGSVANAGWFNMKKVGNTIQGFLEGMYKRPDLLSPKGESEFFQIKLIADCEVRMGHGHDADIVTAHAGDYVNLNDGPKTKDLRSLLADIRQGARYQVHGTVAGEKIPLNGGKTMHNFELFTMMVKPPTAAEDMEPDFSGATSKSDE